MKRRRRPDTLPGVVGMLLALLGSLAGSRYATQRVAALPHAFTRASVTSLAAAAAGVLLLSLLRRIASGGALAPRSRRRQRVGLALVVLYEWLWAAGGLLTNLAATHLPAALAPHAGLLAVLALMVGIMLAAGDALIQRIPNTAAVNRRNFLALLEARYSRGQDDARRGGTQRGPGIAEEWDGAQGEQVLILSGPESRQRARLFDLGLQLVRQAREDLGSPIPVIFNVVSWAGTRLRLADWLVDDLEHTYQVPQRIARSWVEASQVQPLLDGLDDLADQPTRELCVEAINTFLAAHPTLPLVVRSRLAVYRPRQMRLALRPAERGTRKIRTVQPSSRPVSARYSSSVYGSAWFRGVTLVLAALLGIVLTPPTRTSDAPTPYKGRVATIQSQDASVPTWGLGAVANLRAGGAAWENPVLLSHIEGLRLSTMGFPGGGARYYDWKHGTFNLQLDGQPTLIPAWGYGSTVITLAQVRDLYKQIHATPVFTVNMITSGPNSNRPCSSVSNWSPDWQAMLDDQIAFLRSAQSLGLPVKLVELGNEMYWETCLFPTGAVYGSIATHWADGLHAAFPGVQVALSGAPTGSGGIPASVNAWNSDMLTTAKDYDAISMHLYAYENNSSLNINTDQCALQRDGLNRLSDAQVAANFLGTAYVWVEANRSLLRTLPANVHIWTTESAVSDPVHGVSGTWAEGLVSALFTTNLMTYPNMDVFEEYSAVEESLYGEIFESNGYSGRDGCTQYPTPHEYEYSAKGFALQLVGQAVYGMSASAPIAFAPPLQLAGIGSRGVPTPALVGRGYWNGSKETALLLNLSGQPQQVVVANPRKSLQWGSFVQYSGNPAMLTTGDANSTGGASILKRTQGSAPNGAVTLAPYSITLLSTR